MILAADIDPSPITAWLVLIATAFVIIAGSAPSTAVGSYIKTTPMGPAAASGRVVAECDWS